MRYEARLNMLVSTLCWAVANSAAPAPAPPASELGWTTTILDHAAVAHGAVCLDGSPPGYHIQPKDLERWTIHLQGGGWCVSKGDCMGRSKGALGSSKSYMTDMDAILAGSPTGSGWNGSTPDHGDGGAHGIFSSEPTVNPDFYNHTKAYVRYCDGASFAGNVAAPIAVGPEPGQIYFRGRRVLDAVLDSLITAGLGKAKLDERGAVSKRLCPIRDHSFLHLHIAAGHPCGEANDSAALV